MVMAKEQIGLVQWSKAKGRWVTVWLSCGLVERRL